MRHSLMKIVSQPMAFASLPVAAACARAATAALPVNTAACTARTAAALADASVSEHEDEIAFLSFGGTAGLTRTAGMCTVLSGVTCSDAGRGSVFCGVSSRVLSPPSEASAPDAAPRLHALAKLGCATSSCMERSKSSTNVLRCFNRSTAFASASCALKLMARNDSVDLLLSRVDASTDSSAAASAIDRFASVDKCEVASSLACVLRAVRHAFAWLASRWKAATASASGPIANLAPARTGASSFNTTFGRLRSAA
mmetsp:Transcript_45221/g.119946  ORF Transcript_45221/g.119946 Transcript_45221/m.119946 type:complete len:255 (+) Transcript_45221:176-940(+)